MLNSLFDSVWGRQFLLGCVMYLEYTFILVLVLSLIFVVGAVVVLGVKIYFTYERYKVRKIEDRFGPR